MAGGFILKAAIKIIIIPRMRRPREVRRRHLAQVHTSVRAARALPAWLFPLCCLKGMEFRWEEGMQKA